MASVGKIARRTFLIGTAAIAGGVAVGYYYYRKPFANPLEAELGKGEATFNPFVKIGADNTITIIAPRAEMGQGVSTTLAAMVAEELDVSLDRVKVEHGPASHAYYNSGIMEDGGPFAFFDESTTAEAVRAGMGVVGKLLALQGTGGSSSMRDGFEKMRQAGAAARQMLIAAAAQKLDVAIGELETRDGSILHKPSGKSVTYGEVAAIAATMAPPAQVKLKNKADWKLLGKPQKRVDMLDKVTGAPIFGIDVKLPDMLYGTVKMSPRFWSKPIAADLSKAEKMPGVIKIVPIETNYGHGFGIIAENTWAAFKAAEAIETKWADPDYPLDSAAINDVLKQALSQEGSAMRDDGDIETAFADAPRERIVEADYAVPYLAQATMEPMNATAQFKDGVLDYLVRQPVADHLAPALRRSTRYRAEQDHRAHHLPWRWFRPPHRDGLCTLCGADGQGSGRASGQSHLDARRGHAARRVSPRCHRQVSGACLATMVCPLRST